MLAWIKEYQKVLSLGMGALLIVVAATMLFWMNTGEGVSEEERIAAANVARMEARMAAQRNGGQAPRSQVDFMQSRQEKQKEQLRYMVIAMLIGGIGFLGFGLLKKNEKSRRA